MTQQVKLLYILFQAGVNPQSAGQLLAAITNAINSQFTEITILISSPGGNIFQGMNIATLIKASPVPITIHNVGQIDSIAGVIYAAGAKRLAQKNSSFLFHGVKIGFAANVEITEQQLAENLATLKRDRENIAKNISEYSGVGHEKIDTMMRDGVIISAQEAKELGIVHEIIEAKIPNGVQVITIA
jgi:ATP-dependent Clp protease protease subunit